MLDLEIFLSESKILVSFHATVNFLSRSVLYLKVHSQVWDNSWQLKALKRWWKMLFISHQKLFLFSRYLNFCLDFLVMQQNGLLRKIRLVSTFTTSQPGKETIVMYILPNISRSKGNQTMKFGELIECNTWNIFLE